MQGRKLLLVIVISLLAFAMLAYNFRGNEAVAPSTNPMVYVDNIPKRGPGQSGSNADPLVNPVVFPFGTTVGTRFFCYVKLARAPQQTTEPTLDSDVVFAYEFKLSWDKDALELVSADVTKNRPNICENFLEFKTWLWNDDDSTPGSGDEYWGLSGAYGTSHPAAYIGPTLDWVQFSGSLLGSPQNNPLPAEYLDSTIGAYNPAKALGLHAGVNYDLPHTNNGTSTLVQPDGTSVSDGPYQVLAVLNFKRVDITIPCALHIYDPILLNYGLENIGANTFDGYYGTVVVPEFPFGFAPVLLLIPAISILYLWRNRKHKL